MRNIQWLFMAMMSLYMCAFIRSDNIWDEGDQIDASDEPVENSEDSKETIKLSEEQIKVMQQAFQHIFPTLTDECKEEIKESSGDMDKVSTECKEDINEKVKARIEAKAAREARKQAQTEKKQSKKRTKRKKKSSKTNKAKKPDGMRELMIIGYFFAAVFVVVTGYMLFVNQKLKAAGKYFPENAAKQE